MYIFKNILKISDSHFSLNSISIGMNYEEEQAEELESLKSIYYNEIIVLNENPAEFVIEINYVDHSGIRDSDAARLSLRFQYTPKYPEELPNISVYEADLLSEEQQATLIDQLEQSGNENLGGPMIFALVLIAQDWLNIYVDGLKEVENEEIKIREKIQEEIEMKKFQGTIVTPETFYEWKKKFDEEVNNSKMQGADSNINAAKCKKLTGKELFMKDISLNKSDLQFLQDLMDGRISMEAEDENVVSPVEIDEALFEDMSDLQLE